MSYVSEIVEDFLVIRFLTKPSFEEIRNSLHSVIAEYPEHSRLIILEEGVDLETAEVFELSKFYSSSLLAYPKKIAYVVPDKLSIGIVSIYAAATWSTSLTEYQVFQNEAEAWSWLKS